MTERQCKLCIYLWSNCRIGEQEQFYCSKRAKEMETDLHNAQIESITENECPMLREFYKRLKKDDSERKNYEQYSSEFSYSGTDNVAMFRRNFEYLMWYGRFYALKNAIGAAVDTTTYLQIYDEYKRELKRQGLK